MSTSGGYHEYVRNVRYIGGDIMSTLGMFGTLGGIP